MENSPNSSGQRMRWWQEDTANTTQKWYSQPSETVPDKVLSQVTEPLELEDELELEARRRAELERNATVIEGSLGNVLSRTRSVLGWVIAFSVLFYPIVGYQVHSWFLALMPLVFIAEYFLIAAMMQKTFAGYKPQIVMSALGLTLDLPYYRIGPVFWDEIKSVRIVNFMGTQGIRIKLKNPKLTYKRSLSIKSGRMAAMTRRSLQITHLEIAMHWFSIPPQEVVAQINRFLPASDPGKVE